MIGGLITSIDRLVSIEPNPDDKVSGSERLALAAFERMKFCKMKGSRMCWIYPKNKIMPLPNIDLATLMNPDNLSFIPNYEELVHPVP